MSIDNTQEREPGTESLKIQFEEGGYIGQEWSFFLTFACTNPLCPCTEISMTAVPTAALEGDKSRSEAFLLTFDVAKKRYNRLKTVTIISGAVRLQVRVGWKCPKSYGNACTQTFQP